MRSLILLAIALSVLAMPAAGARADAPRLINYQGILIDSEGMPLDGTYLLVFAIYADSAQGADDLWSERHIDVPVEDGLFNVILGGIANIPLTLFEGEERWMGIAVDDNPEMYPRMRITSVPWALRAAVADSAVAISPGSDGDWQFSGDDIYSAVPGYVGIGTDAPLADLHVERYDISLPVAALLAEDIIIEDINAGLGLYSDTGGSYGSILCLGEIDGGLLTNKWSLYRTTGATPSLRFSFGTDPDYAANETVMTMLSSGDVGIGTTSPARKIEVRDTDVVQVRLTTDNYLGSILELKNAVAGAATLGRIKFLNYIDDDEAAIIYYSNPSLMDPGLYFSLDNSNRMMINKDTGFVGIGTVFPDEMLEVAGTVKAQVLKLSGGADVAEPFDISGVIKPEAGMVMAIDPQSPGKLKICDIPYDRCVAGIISGAGGLDPGMIMGQAGSAADGEYPVALTGRVYCWADASGGPIEPGDLLTTSDIPGYAMKVIDHERAQGAVLGKAMSSLETGRGLVLVLVTLQ